MKTLIYSLLLAALISLPVACEGGLDSYGDFNCSGNAKFQGNVNIKDEYNLPAEDGVNGQVIKTDGGGNAQFADETIPNLQQVTSVSGDTTVGIGVGGLTINQTGEFGDASLIFNTGDKTGYLYLAGGNGRFYSGNEFSIGKYFQIYSQGGAENCILNMASAGGSGNITWNDYYQLFSVDQRLEAPYMAVRPTSGTTATLGLFHQAGTTYLDGVDNGLTVRTDGGEILRVNGWGDTIVKKHLAVGGLTPDNAPLFVETVPPTEIDSTVATVDPNFPSGLFLAQQGVTDRVMELFVKINYQVPKVEGLELLGIGITPSEENNAQSTIRVTPDGFVQYSSVVEESSVVMTATAYNIFDDNDWHHLLVVKKGFEYGLYAGGQQVGYAYSELQEPVTENTVRLIAGDTFFCGLELSNVRIQDGDPYGASPNVGLTDSVVVPSSPFIADTNTQLLFPLRANLGDGGIQNIELIAYEPSYTKFTTDGLFGDGSLIIGQTLSTVHINARIVTENYNLPLSDGMSGQVLKTDGNRIVSWQDDLSGGDFEWVVGSGEAGIDYSIIFNGEDSDGTITWLEDEVQFQLACDLAVTDSVFVARDFAVGGTGLLDSALYVQRGLHSLLNNGVWTHIDNLPTGLVLPQAGVTNRTIDFFVRLPLDTAGDLIKTGAHPFTGTNDHWDIWINENGSVSMSGVIEALSLQGNLNGVGNLFDNAWHHIVMAKRGTNYGLYIDGVQLDYISSGLESAPELNQLEFGGNQQFTAEIIDYRVEDSDLFTLAPNVGLTDTYTVPTTGAGVTANTSILFPFRTDLVPVGDQTTVLYDRVEASPHLFSEAGYFGDGSLMLGFSSSGIKINTTTDIVGNVSIEGKLTDENSKVLAGSLKTISVTVPKPIDLAEADAFPLWTNRSGNTFTITGIYSNSDTDDVGFTLVEVNDLHDFTAVTTIEAIAIETDGTGIFYDDRITGIDHTTIETDHAIVFDNDATDDPAFVNITIVGYFN